MKKMNCPHCGGAGGQTYALNTHPEYGFADDEYLEYMICATCKNYWMRVYKPSHDIKEE